jgi:hypothetical protein
MNHLVRVVKRPAGPLGLIVAGQYSRLYQFAVDGILLSKGFAKFFKGPRHLSMSGIPSA